eukprot:6708512-Alexandrium_andersonii.AAC.1
MLVICVARAPFSRPRVENSAGGSILTVAPFQRGSVQARNHRGRAGWRRGVPGAGSSLCWRAWWPGVAAACSPGG